MLGDEEAQLTQRHPHRCKAGEGKPEMLHSGEAASGQGGVPRKEGAMEVGVSDHGRGRAAPHQVLKEGRELGTASRDDECLPWRKCLRILPNQPQRRTGSLVSHPSAGPFSWRTNPFVRRRKSTLLAALRTGSC